jgi:hypothetical protein
MKDIQRDSLYENSCRFGQGRIQKFYSPARIVMEMLPTRLLFNKGKKYLKLTLDILFSE